MAGTSTATRQLSAGDIVVPLSEIIQRLASKLSQADIDSLVSAILAGRTDVVRPGDLITADLMNQMLADIADLQTRVLTLEGGLGTAAGQVIITRPLPGEQFKVGGDMTVQGQNFGFSNGTMVLQLDGVRVTAFKPGSNDQSVAFTVPEMTPPVLPGGRAVLLTVANDRSSAIRQIQLNSAQDLTGSIDVVFTGVDPATVPVGSKPQFKFTLHSRANYDAQYTIQPVVSGVTDPTTWNSGLLVLGGTLVKVPAGGDVPIVVQLTLPAVADQTPFTLAVGATSGPVMGTTGPIRVVVGTGPQLPDPNTTLSYDAGTTLFDPAGSGSVIQAPDEDTVQVKAGALAQIGMVAEFKALGSYAPSISAVNEGTTKTSNWSLKLHPQDPTSYTITQAMLNNPDKKTSRTLRFLISPSSDPSAPASATGEAEFQLALSATTKTWTRMKLALQ